MTKWTPSVNFINILQAAFAPLFLHQKLQKPNCKHRKAAQNSYVQKDVHLMLIKLTPVNFINIIQADFTFAKNWKPKL